jgi:enterochelin esterase-like enzyme
LFAFYVGRGDTRFLAENEQLNGELVAAQIPHVFDVYAGAHTTSLWRSRAAAWLQLGLNRLAKPLR